MSKKYSEKDLAKVLAKSMWKSVKKAIGTKNPVQDVLDNNRTAEAKPSTVPATSTSVMNKGVNQPAPKPKKLKSFVAEREERIKKKRKL